METLRRIDRDVLLSMTALSAAGMFILLGYAFARTVSVSLFIEYYGASRLPYVLTAVPVFLALMIYVYGWLLSRWGAKKTLLATTLFSAAVFVACYAGLKAGFAPAAAVLDIFREAYIVLILEQYWSLVNSKLKPGEAKLLNGPITGLASVGPIAGGLLVNRLAVSLGSEQLILIAAASLLPAAWLSYKAYCMVGEPKRSAEEERAGHVNLRLLARSRVLLLLVAVISITQVLSTSLTLGFYGLLETSIPFKDARTAYLGGFWSAVNTAAFLLQFVIAPLALRWFSLRKVHLAMPLVHLAACAVLFFHPTLGAAAIALLAFKSIDYSVFRAAKEVLYIPLSFDARYRAKQVIDTFTYRFSKGATGGAYSAVTAAFGAVPIAGHALVACGAALTWIWIAVPLTANNEET